MGNFYCSLGHNHMPTHCLRMTNCIHKLLPGGSALIWRAGQTETEKKIAFLTEWADKHNRPHKSRKGWRLQSLPAEGTENTHQRVIRRMLSSTTSKESERTRTCCRQNTNIHSCNEKKKDYDKVTSKPMLEVPVLGVRYTWVLKTSLEERVIRCDSPDMYTWLFRNRDNPIYSCHHPGVSIHWHYMLTLHWLGMNRTSDSF